MCVEADNCEKKTVCDRGIVQNPQRVGSAAQARKQRSKIGLALPMVGGMGVELASRGQKRQLAPARENGALERPGAAGISDGVAG